MKKKILIIMVLVIIMFLSIIIKYNDDRLELKKDIFSFEFGNKVPFEVNYYLKNSMSKKELRKVKMKLKNNYPVKQENKILKTIGKKYLDVGEYEVSIEYKKNTKYFKIKVKDTIAPKFVHFKKDIYLEKDALDVDLSKFYESKDLSESTIVVESDYNINEVGDYKAIVKTSDNYKNITKKKATIHVIDDAEDSKITATVDGIIYRSQRRVEEENKEETYSSNSISNKVVNSGNTTKSGTNYQSNQNTNNNVSTSTYRTDIASQFASQINSYRVASGLPALPITSEAQNEANTRARQLVDNFSHDSSYGFGENIGEGSIGSDFVSAWKNSYIHNNTMLREQTTAFAVSVYQHNNMWYVVASFKMNY